MGKQWKQWQTLFCRGGAPKSLQMVTVAMKFKDICSLEENYDRTVVFPVIMYGCESWTIKKGEC